jgi:hypothetical protein
VWQRRPVIAEYFRQILIVSAGHFVSDCVQCVDWVGPATRFAELATAIGILSSVDLRFAVIVSSSEVAAFEPSIISNWLETSERFVKELRASWTTEAAFSTAALFRRTFSMSVVDWICATLAPTRAP